MPKVIAQKIDWIKLGYQSFATGGARGIVVEKLAKMLSCNKSSFYWHFKSKEAFIAEIIQFWIAEETTKIISQTNTCRSPEEKIIRLIELAFKQDEYIDFIFYLKNYARNKPAIQQIIDNVDQNRIAYVKNLLIEVGYSEKIANASAHLFYKYLIGYHEILKHKKQSSNYIQEVLNEIKPFIKLNHE